MIAGFVVPEPASDGVMPGVGGVRCRLSSKPGVLEVAGCNWEVAIESGGLLTGVLLERCGRALDPGFAALCEPLVSESIVCFSLPASASEDRCFGKEVILVLGRLRWRLSRVP